MKKLEFKIGEVVPGTKLMVIGMEESDAHGNQRVLVRCLWDGIEKVMRASAMTFEPYEDKNGKLRLPHRSCGCQSRLAHQMYWEKRAKGIRRMVQQRIYRARRSRTRTFQELALEHNLPLPVVTTIFRLYAAKYGR
jgi:hypothetical protein